MFCSTEPPVPGGEMHELVLLLFCPPTPEPSAPLVLRRFLSPGAVMMPSRSRSACHGGSFGYHQGFTLV